jgi:hypothetical protein
MARKKTGQSSSTSKPLGDEVISYIPDAEVGTTADDPEGAIV